MRGDRTYSELSQISTFEGRFDYLVMGGLVGRLTFGSDRWMNQQFYQSYEWRRAREAVIARDLGCDLGIEGYEIYSDLLVHHINTMTVEDIAKSEPWICDPEYLITTTKQTHNAIHYGDRTLLPRGPVERRVGDTRLW